MRCLLVEDSVVIQQSLSSTLKEMLDICVIGVAPDEQTAVQWLRQRAGSFDLMITDIFLKSGSGLNVLAKASELCPDVPRVVLTNYATQQMRRRCMELGAHQVFDKSAELDELLAYCETLCDGDQ